MVEIEFDSRAMKRWLSRLERQEIPFAISASLNSTAFDLREDAIKELPQKFIIRSKYTEKGYQVNKANKRTLEVEFGQARDYMVKQETGG